jgi:hypothetical protein
MLAALNVMNGQFHTNNSKNVMAEVGFETT